MSSMIRQLYHFATDFDRVLLQLVGTDVENSLFKYTVSQKNDNDVLCYNFEAHQPILIIFGRDIAE